MKFEELPIAIQEELLERKKVNAQFLKSFREHVIDCNTASPTLMIISYLSSKHFSSLLNYCFMGYYDYRSHLSFVLGGGTVLGKRLLGCSNRDDLLKEVDKWLV